MPEAEKRGRRVEAAEDLASTLEDLRAYRERDPDFARAIAEVVDAEVTAARDPAERACRAAGRPDPEGMTETTSRA